MTGKDAIPFLDLAATHIELGQELTDIFKRALHTASFIGGPMVEEFERAFADFCDTKFCVGVGSGTDALRFALIAAGVKHGEIVVTVPNTFIATTEAISQAGARVDFVDVDERTYNMNAEELRGYLETCCKFDFASGKLLHRKTQRPVTAIIPVHLYGQMSDMDAILDLAERYNLIVIEDACQAHGAEYFSTRENRWRKAGSMGHAAAFSFYPGKNLGACGEGGAVTTNNENIAKNVGMLRDHGQRKKYYHEIEGYNGRLDAVQAGILGVKLRHLADWNRKRQEAARRYDELFTSIEEVTVPYEPEWSRGVYHLYVVRVPHREGLQKHLSEAKINVGIHYPVPLHLQKAYAGYGHKTGAFPVTEKVAAEIVSLPMYPHLQAGQQESVVEKVNEYVTISSPSVL